jgi:hypothetical protein
MTLEVVVAPPFEVVAAFEADTDATVKEVGPLMLTPIPTLDNSASASASAIEVVVAPHF